MTAFVRSASLLVILAASMPVIVVAQEPPRAASKSCVRARPAPDCRAFFITNLGVYKTRESEPLFRAVLDWGKMVNVSSRHAYGGSWFVTFDGDGLVTGPVARYRRWLERGRSLDLAVGTPVVSSEGSAGTKPGSILGLVKYNPVNWFGVAVRPNYLRSEEVVCGSPGVCTNRASNSVRVIAGVEVGGVPGLVTSLAAGAMGLLLFMAFS